MSAAGLVARAARKGLRLTAAESCTGGLIAAAITAIPGASAVFTHGFVTYANTAKTEMLGVPAGLFATVGAVSQEVALAMAQGARAAAAADYAIAVTGIAGPGGGTPDKPVGTVCFGLAGPDGAIAHTRHFTGDRDEVRAASVAFALDILTQACGAEA